MPTSPECRHAVALRGVSVGYGPDLALEAVNASVGLGAALALVGPNGAGKSSLLKAILGLLPLRAGSISVLGRSPADARPDVGYVPQAATLDGGFPVSVRQVVMMMGRYRRVGWLRRPGRGDRVIVDDALERAGLGQQARLAFGSLSGGQRQRVLVARAIAQEPRLLLLDEPFNGVDATSQRLLLDTLAGLRAGGASVIMATHDLVAVRWASCECCLLNRRLHAFGTAEEVLAAGPLSQMDLAAYLVGSVLTVCTGDVVATAMGGAAICVVVVALHKELVLGAFDPDAARALGYPVERLDAVVLVVVALAVVTAAPAVGVILVVALLVAPAAAARQWASTVGATMALGALLGGTSGAAGLWVSHALDIAAGAAVVLVACAVYMVSLVAGRRLAGTTAVPARPSSGPKSPRPRGESCAALGREDGGTTVASAVETGLVAPMRSAAR